MSSERKGARTRVILFAAVALLVFLLHMQTIWFDFVQWDDDISIYKNPNLALQGWDLLKWAFTDVDLTMRYMPLTLLGLSATYKVAGLWPGAYHLGNLVLFSAAAGLFSLVLLELVTGGGEHRKTRGAYIASGLGSLLWAFHPMRVEVVAWSNERGYCQGTLFLTAAVLAYLRYLRSQEKDSPQGAGLVTAAVTAYILSLLSHPIGITAFLALFLLEGCFSRPRVSPEGGTRRLLVKAALVSCAGIFAAMALAVRIQGAGLWSRAPSFSEFGLLHRTAQACYVVVYYLVRPLWPVHLTPVNMDLVDFDPLSLRFLGSMTIVAAITALLFLKRDKVLWLFRAWLAYLVLLVPVMGFTEHPHYPADRYGILAAMIPCGMFSMWLGLGPWKGTRKASVIIAVSVVFVFGWLSFRQAGTWRNTSALFEHMLELLPSDAYLARADINERYARYLREQGLETQALQKLEMAAEIASREPRLWAELGRWLEQAGKNLDSLKAYGKAYDLRPENARFCYLYGRILLKLDRVGQALPKLECAVEKEPGNPWHHNDLGVALLKTGRVDEALAELETALALKPADVAIIRNLKKALKLAGDRAGKGGGP